MFKVGMLGIHKWKVDKRGVEEIAKSRQSAQKDETRFESVFLLLEHNLKSWVSFNKPSTLNSSRD